MRQTHQQVQDDAQGDAAPEDRLSERELEILQLIATGASNREIAKQLVISPNTVKVHVRNTFSKIGVRSRTEAAVFAIREGIAGNPIAGGQQRERSLPDGSASSKLGFPNLHQFTRLVAGATVLLGVTVLLWRSGAISQPFATAGSNEPTTISDNRWTSRAQLPTARSRLAVAVHDGEIYAIGGQTGQGVTGALEQYDPTSDVWTILPEKPVAVADVGAAVLGGKIYVPGGRLASGDPTDVLEIYDTREGSWDQGARLPAPLAAYALAAVEGRLYLFGGWDGMGFVPYVFEYSPVDDRWRVRTQMPTARAYAGAALIRGRVQVIGGYDGVNSLAINEAYSPELDGTGEGPWETDLPMPEGRFGIAVVSVADIVHVLGGKSENGAQLPPLKYTPDRAEWQAFEMPSGDAWTDFGAAVVGTRLFLIGGQAEGSPTAQNVAFQAIYTVLLPVLE